MEEQEFEDGGEADDDDSRRGFLKKTASTLLGGGIMAAPIAAGVTVLLDPLRRPAGEADFVRVTRLDALPESGEPQTFQVITDRQDAWNHFPNVPVGSIYLARRNERVIAFNTSCPHAGCAVDYQGEEGRFFCPCHNSVFGLDGSIQGTSPSARGLDTLETEIRDGDVWVKFQNFKAGVKEKLPIA